jgi:hypothetical protein
MSAHAEKNDLAELLVHSIRKAVDAHIVKTRKHVFGRFAKLQEVLGHDTD